MSVAMTEIHPEQSIEDQPPKNSTRPLLAGLMVMLLLMCTGLGIGIYQLRQMTTTLDAVVKADDVARDAINTMLRVSRERTLILTEVVGLQDAFARDEKILEFNRLAGVFGAALQRQNALSVTREEKAVLAEQTRMVGELVEQLDYIVALTSQGAADDAEHILHSVAIPAQSRMLDTLMHWTEIHSTQHRLEVKVIQARQKQVVGMMIGVAVSSIVVGLLVALVVYRWNSRLITLFVDNEAHLKSTMADLTFRQQALDAHSISSVADSEGRILYVNDKFCEVSGYRSEELIGQNHRIVKSAYHPAEFFQDMWETISSGRVWQGTIKNRAKSGRHYWVETTIVPMMDESGLPIRYMSLRTEVTRIMEMEEAVREANIILKSNVIERTQQLELAKQQLEQELVDRERNQVALQQSYDELKDLHRQLQDAQQYLMQSEKLAAVGQLAAGMAHEINNPIGFITSNLTSLVRYLATLRTFLDRYRQLESELTDDSQGVIASQRKEADLDFVLEDSLTLLEECQNGLGRVSRIVRDLRNFAQTDSGNQRQCVDMTECLETTLNLLGEHFSGEVNIYREYGQGVLVECNPAELNQVFVNLLNNAVQALKGSGSITLRSGQEGEQAWVEVEDTGDGISDEALPHIFEPFYTTRAIGQGAGLGLPMAYGIIQKHGGKIAVKSRVGVGSIFRISLPLGHGEDTFSEEPAASGMASRSLASHAG